MRQIEVAGLEAVDLEVMGLEVEIVAAAFRCKLGPDKVGAAAGKVVAAAGKVVAADVKVVAAAGKVVAAVEIDPPMTFVGSWHRIVGSSEVVKKAVVVEQDSIAAGPVVKVVSAAGSPVPLVGWRLASVAARASRPIRGK